MAIVGPELVRWCAGDCGGNGDARSGAAPVDAATTACECGEGLWGEERLDTIELSLLLLLLMPLPCVEWRVDMAGEEGRELLVDDTLLRATALVGL